MTKPKKWKPYRPRKRRRKFKSNRTYLEAYEEGMILGDMRAIVGDSATYVGTRDFELHAPGRYNHRYLRVAMKRLKKKGVVSQASAGRYLGYRWAITENVIRERAAA